MLELTHSKLISLVARATSFDEINQLIFIINDLISSLKEIDPITETLYAEILEKRNNISKKPNRFSIFPTKIKSQKNRSEAAQGLRNPIKWARKRRLGDMAALPPQYRDQFTEGERAVLYIVASDFKKDGHCKSTNKEIADRAGVALTTARNAIRKAKNIGLISVQERKRPTGKNLSNLIKISCQLWNDWLIKFKPKLGFNFSLHGVKKPTTLVNDINNNKKDIINSIFIRQKPSKINCKALE